MWSNFHFWKGNLTVSLGMNPKNLTLHDWNVCLLSQYLYLQKWKKSVGNRDWLNNEWPITGRLADRKILLKENIWYRKLLKMQLWRNRTLNCIHTVPQENKRNECKCEWGFSLTYWWGIFFFFATFWTCIQTTEVIKGI